MSYNLNIYGHDAPSADVETAARDAFKRMLEAGATGGSVTGQGNDGVPISITFPESAERPSEAEGKT